jgi:hypothetical protein
VADHYDWAAVTHDFEEALARVAAGASTAASPAARPARAARQRAS